MSFIKKIAESVKLKSTEKMVMGGNFLVIWRAETTGLAWNEVTPDGARHCWLLAYHQKVKMRPIVKAASKENILTHLAHRGYLESPKLSNL